MAFQVDKNGSVVLAFEPRQSSTLGSNGFFFVRAVGLQFGEAGHGVVADRYAQALEEASSRQSTGYESYTSNDFTQAIGLAGITAGRLPASVA
jgi:hypothetical protein